MWLILNLTACVKPSSFSQANSRSQRHSSVQKRGSYQHHMREIEATRHGNAAGEKLCFSI